MWVRGCAGPEHAQVCVLRARQCRLPLPGPLRHPPGQIKALPARCRTVCTGNAVDFAALFVWDLVLCVCVRAASKKKTPLVVMPERPGADSLLPFAAAAAAAAAAKKKKKTGRNRGADRVSVGAGG
eukprot:541780-Rhodomonas_salina.1